MKSYVVIGLGRFGAELATRLYACGEEVMAIDTNGQLVDKSRYRYEEGCASLVSFFFSLFMYRAPKVPIPIAMINVIISHFARCLFRIIRITSVCDQE